MRFEGKGYLTATRLRGFSSSESAGLLEKVASPGTDRVSESDLESCPAYAILTGSKETEISKSGQVFPSISGSLMASQADIELSDAKSFKSCDAVVLLYRGSLSHLKDVKIISGDKRTDLFNVPLPRRLRRQQTGKIDP